MKKGMVLLSAISLLLITTIGCIVYGKTVAKDTIIVRIVNQSHTNLCELAIGYSVNGKMLGSVTTQKIKENEYEFIFKKDMAICMRGMPKQLQLDVYASKRAGVDFLACGSAVIDEPRFGKTYTLLLNGDAGTELFLFPGLKEEKVKIYAAGVMAR
ncbi:MAG: hypothetical protein E7277_09255 [Lachnospiraceae bacterium]|nr:hypothetical protein [Lachnospiraceae bacterium]